MDLLQIELQSNCNLIGTSASDYEIYCDLLCLKKYLSDRFVGINNLENETFNVGIDVEEIKDVVNEEWRKSKINIRIIVSCIFFHTIYFQKKF